MFHGPRNLGDGGAGCVAAGGLSLREQVQRFALQGRRVLLVARSDALLNGQELPADLQPAALVTLSEQVRPDAKDTLQYFADQGVTIKVISGDNPVTVA